MTEHIWEVRGAESEGDDWHAGHRDTTRDDLAGALSAHHEEDLAMLVDDAARCAAIDAMCGAYEGARDRRHRERREALRPRTGERLWPAAQIAAAHAVASAHGHGWASAYTPDGAPVSLEGIARVTFDDNPDWPGITPMAGEDGRTLVHVTGTGRLSWSVAADGGVTICVCRPRGTALTVRVRAGARTCAAEYGPATALLRHWTTAQKAVRALSAVLQLPPIVADLRARLDRAASARIARNKADGLGEESWPLATERLPSLWARQTADYAAGAAEERCADEELEEHEARVARALRAKA